MNKIIKNIITNCIKENINNIIKKIEKYEIVSFDLFDTLITRYVPVSTDLFDIIGREASKVIDDDYLEFKKKRIECEKKAVRLFYPDDPTIEQIYREYDNLDDYQRKKLVEIEENTEIKFCYPRNEIVDILNYCVKNKKRVLIISDTPLSECVIKRILDKCGINGYSELYLSSNESHTKYSGKLFEFVLNKEHIGSKDIIHIGDSLRSDYLNSRKNQINSILIDVYNNKTCLAKKKIVNSRVEYKILQKFIEIHENGCLSIYGRMGYEILGPLLLSFVWWLEENNTKDTELLFLAREGVILKRIYELVYPENKDKVKVLRVSRRSISGCSLFDIVSAEQLFNELKTFSLDKLSLKELCDLGFIEERYAICFSQKHNVTLETNILVDKTIRTFFENEILPLIVDYSKKQRKMFLKYLEQMVNNEHDVALVDVGWRGSMQDKLVRFFPEFFKETTRGFYYGVQLDSRIEGHNIKNKKGALFIETGAKCDDYCVITLTGQIFEMMFMDLEFGSTIKYTYKNGVVYPIFNKSEYNGEARLALYEMQEAAFQFVSDYINSELCNDMFSCVDAFQQYKNVFTNPSNSVVDSIREFSTFDVSLSSLVPNKSIFYWFAHPNKFIKEFKSNHSKSIFLQSVFKVRLPYYKILQEILKKAD